MPLGMHLRKEIISFLAGHCFVFIFYENNGRYYKLPRPIYNEDVLV